MSDVFYQVNGKEYCDEAQALSEMLAYDGLLFVGGRMGPLFEPKDGQDDEPAAIYINCNDLFMWGCAEAIPLPQTEIGNFYKAWKSGKHGATEWCCVRQNMQPQKPIREMMKKAGAWSGIMKALPSNPDEIV